MQQCPPLGPGELRYPDTVTTDPPPDDLEKALPLQLNLPPAPKPPPAPAAPPARRDAAAHARALLRSGLIVTPFVAVVCVATFGYALPWFVRRQCIDVAAAHGITLEVDNLRFGASGFRLVGVKATMAEVGGVSASAPEVEVELGLQGAGLRPQKLTARSAELRLEGRWATVAAEFARWRASPGGGEDGAWAPAALAVEGSRVVWKGPVAENAGVDAAGVHLDVAWQGKSPAVHGSSSHVMVDVPGGTLGPWAMDVDHGPPASRVRVALDPAVPEACTVLVVSNDDMTTSVDVAVPRSPLGRLGIPAQLVGLRGREPGLEATVHYTRLGPAQSRAQAKVGLYGVEVPGVSRPIDVVLDGSASGDPRAGVDVTQAKLALGPLVGDVRGRLRTYTDGFRLDAAWHAGPVPCAALEAPLDPGQPFDVAYQLRKLAQAAGLDKVVGTVSASGTLVIDSRDLGASSVTFAPDAKCGVALFVAH